jgi:hypothetical protein
MGVEASDAQAIEETREAHVAALNKRRRGRLGGRLCQRRRSDAALTKASTEERAPALPIAPRLLLSESAALPGDNASQLRPIGVRWKVAQKRCRRIRR